MSPDLAVGDLVLAVTGASGSPYAQRLLETLLRAGRTVHLVVSPAAIEVLLHETDRRLDPAAFRLRDLRGPLADELRGDLVRHHDYRDFAAGIASGSFPTAGMVVCPCSMGTAAAIAAWPVRPEPDSPGRRRPFEGAPGR